MAEASEAAPNLAVFCDFENVAIGVQDAKYDSFDIEVVLERLLDKGKIVVKKAYADWDRYKADKKPMHEAAFELIEIPHVSYSGKNSADIRMVVDALDLCHTKEHVEVFVIISGDSDFSPLVSKLRENDKMVIGVGVKNSSSDLLIENCDEFIYYDDLVRDRHGKSKDSGRGRGRGGRGRSGRRGGAKKAGAASTEKETAGEGDASNDKERGGDKEEAIELVLGTVEALFREREDHLWGSMVKQTLKRKRPNFAESYYGYRSFNELLEDCEQQQLLELQKDERSGGYLILGFGSEA